MKTFGGLDGFHANAANFVHGNADTDALDVSLEVFDELCDALKVEGAVPSAVRRNVFTRDVDLNKWIGQDFEIQGVRFHGTEESRPCDWMDRAIATGAESFLKGRGGLRARILSDGLLHSTARIAAAA